MAGGSPPRLRAASACTACNKKKIRCVFAGDSRKCVNCQRNQWDCHARKRKRRRVDLGVGINHRDGAESQDSRQTTWAQDAELVWEPGRAVVATSRPLIDSAAIRGQLAGRQDDTQSLSIPGDPLYPRGASSMTRMQQSPRTGENPYESPGSSSFLGRSEYIRGDIPINEDQAKSYPVGATEDLSDDDIRILQLQHAFDMPPRAVRDSLTDTFMRCCAPWTPIVERSWLEERNGTQPSVLLLQAVFLAASRVSSAPAVTAYASSDDFYRRAKALFWSGYEKNTITTIAAVCILHWYNPEGPEHVSINTSGFWRHVGVGLAHQIGLHKEPPGGKDAALRRRLWWSLFARDCLISAGQGRPLAINLDDCEVRPPSIEDFHGSSSNAALFIAYVEICSLLGDLTQCCCRKSMSRQKRQYIETALYRWTRALPESLRPFRSTGPSEASSVSVSNLAPYSFEARQLHIPYFIILAILFRPSTPGSPPSAAALTASSFVTGIFEDFLARDEIRFLGPIFTFYLLAAGVTLLSSYRFPHIWDQARKDLDIIYSAQKELAKRWPSATGSLKALQSITDEVTKLTRQAEPPQVQTISGEQVVFFDGFGPELCSLWPFFMSHPGAENLSGRRGLEEDQCSRTESDLMTAGILTELKTPMATPAAVDGYLPLATVLDHQRTPAVAESGELADEMLPYQYGGIGNWLLRDWDWSNDMAW